ncbi:MAG: glutamate--cysteine ligase [Gammaproteobacteria bacterium]|nr:glutamate--cysteine ligase [Gammaproteobacteria bacterium]NNC97812.1 glutamate--cysteine ligase [Gammaproteobacteria bacterium]NNM13845.1 glutamate--cysteine ligase [Gammaproteobacteria bacterium]
MTSEYFKVLESIRDMGGAEILVGGLRGVEKESLRVSPDGTIAKTRHPKALGSALTHPYITTDYSEAQLEFVTPPYANNWQVMQSLTELHQYTHKVLHQQSDNQDHLHELIWPASMPCMVTKGSDVPVAKFGSSNVGRMKHVYRLGLGYRYGRTMQTISGVHFNYSIPERFWPIYREFQTFVGKQSEDFISSQYFHILRNLRRSSWIILYLFGCSPAVCKSFNVSSDGLEEMYSSYYLPHATSLRMSNIGYKNESQSSIQVSANSLQEYITDLTAAISTPYPEYDKIGVKVDGEYRQLNSNLLQIENEYYTLVRPKRVARSGEKPSEALKRAGVQYLELRALDNSLFDPVGVNSDEMYFLELLVWYCLFYPSQPLTPDEETENSQNQLKVAREGRKPDLKLLHHGRERNLQEWGRAMCEDMQPLAKLLDQGLPEMSQPLYSRALQKQIDKIIDPEKTPSARILCEMREQKISFYHLSKNIAVAHHEYFSALHLNEKKYSRLSEIAKKSLARQSLMEKNDHESFDDYLAKYFAK